MKAEEKGLFLRGSRFSNKGLKKGVWKRFQLENQSCCVWITPNNSDTMKAEGRVLENGKNQTDLSNSNAIIQIEEIKCKN